MTTLISVKALLRQKWYTPRHRFYGLIPIMALWHDTCPYCGKRTVAKTGRTVENRVYKHMETCSKAPKEGVTE